MNTTMLGRKAFTGSSSSGAVMAIEASAIEADFAVQEANEAYAEFVETNIVLEQLDNAVASLEDIQTATAARTEEGGLDSISAQYMAIAADAAMRPFGGYAASGSTIAAQEDFDDADSRVSVTVAAQEGFVDTIKKAGQAVINFLKKMWEKVQDFLRKNLKLAERMEKKAKDLGDEAKKAKGSPKESEMKVGGSVKYFYIDGSLSEKHADNVAQMTTVVNDWGFGDASLTAAQEGEKMFDNVAKALKDIKEAGDADKMEDNSVAVDDVLPDGKELSGDDRYEDFEKAVASASAPGDMAVISAAKAKDGAVTSVKCDFTRFEDSEADYDKDEELKAIGASDVTNMAAAVEKLASAIQDSDKGQGKLDKAMKKFEKTLDGVEKELGRIEKIDGISGKTSEISQQIRTGTKVAGDQLRAAISVGGGVVRHGMSVGNTYLAFGKKCLGNLEE